MMHLWVRFPRVRSLAGGAIALFLLVAGGSSAARADAAAGRSAFEKGDFARAMTEWQAAADHGDPEGEFGLGNLYEFGAGDLQQNYKSAVHWYRKAAEQGNTEAEYRLALLYGAGGDNFDSDLGEAYKWAILAARSEGVWGTRAGDFKRQLDKVTGFLQRQQAEKLADTWTQQRTAAKEPGTGLPTPAPSAKTPATGCPGFPFPALPCTEQPPSWARPQGLPPAQSEPPPKAAPPPADPLQELNKSLAKLNCAALRAHSSGSGSVTVSGTVPAAGDMASVRRLAERYFSSDRLQLPIDVVPPPLCRSLVEFDRMERDGLVATDGLGVTLNNGSPLLHEGDRIELAVHAPAYPVNLRIDYFSLDGRVQHLEREFLQPPRLEAGSAQVFGQAANGKDYWQAGPAPFGTEMIAIIATPQPLLPGNREGVEQAANYLRDLKEELDRIRPDAGQPDLLATLLVKTSARRAVGK
jgi:hypothetical protein